MYWSKFLLSLVSKLLFKKEERIEINFTPEEIIDLISSVTVKVNEKDGKPDLENVSGIKPKFVGLIKPSFFCVSKKVSHPQSFLPRVTGRVKEKDSSIYIDLTYQIFPLTKFFFFGFVLLCVVLQFISVYKSQTLFFLILPTLAIVLTYTVALANFKLHCKDIRRVLKEELYF